MSREIVRDHGVMLLLGSMRAEERLAAFLLNLTQRLQARGFSASALMLRMTREEIGSYLGLKLETVSRTFSKFQDDGILEVKQRQIRILDQSALQRAGQRLVVITGSMCFQATTAVARLAMTTDSGPPSTSHTIGNLYQGIGLSCMGQPFCVQRGTTKVDFSCTVISPPESSGRRVILNRIGCAPAPSAPAVSGGTWTLTGTQRDSVEPTSTDDLPAMMAPFRPSTSMRKRCGASVAFITCRR
jgi:hypothetical protein